MFVAVLSYLKNIFSKIDYRFLIFYLLLLLFPHYLARDLNSLFLLTLVYIMVILLFKRFTDLSTFEILLYVLIAISFAGLHILYNHEYGRASLGRSMQRIVDGPWLYRALIPKMMNFFVWVFGVGHVALRASFRFFFLSMTFLSMFCLLRCNLRLNRVGAYLLPLLFVFMIPFSWDLLYVTDFPEIFFSAILLLMIFYRKKNWFVFFAWLAMLNRSATLLFALSFYFFYVLLPDKFSVASFREKLPAFKKELFYAGILLLGFAVFRVLVIMFYGDATWVENHFAENIEQLEVYQQYLAGFHVWGISDFQRVPRMLSFAGGIYILFVVFWRRVNRRFLVAFLFSSVIFAIPYILYANINETRVLFPLLPYFVYGIGSIMAFQEEGGK